MNRFFKIIKKIILVIISVLLLYGISVLVLPLITVSKDQVTDEVIEIHILTNGVHADIVVPVKTDQMDWSKNVSYSNTKRADSTFGYLSMGRGDKGFYLETPNWADLNASVAVNAAFGLSATAIHATYYKTMTISEHCKSMMLSKKQYAKLIDYISSSFQTDSEGSYLVIDTDAAYGKTDAFYEANGSYSVFTTCNTWANSGLKMSGQKCCFWTALDWGIFSKYE
jgi:uncharacterized protein (TIGR02117 family)